MKKLPNEKLYTDINYCLHSINNYILKDSNIDSNIQLFHCYWYGDNFGRKQALSIKSWIMTQNLKKSILFLWLDKKSGYDTHQNNPHIKPLLPFIKVNYLKRFDSSLG